MDKGMRLKSDRNSEHVAHASRKIGFFENINMIFGQTQTDIQ